MKKQYAVFGLGSFGESVAIELQKLGCEVVAIDANMERVEAIANQVSYAMKADIEDADFIRSLGTRNLDGVVVAHQTIWKRVSWQHLCARKLAFHMLWQRQKMNFMQQCLRKSEQILLFFRKKRWECVWQGI